MSVRRRTQVQGGHKGTVPFLLRQKLGQSPRCMSWLWNGLRPFHCFDRRSPRADQQRLGDLRSARWHGRETVP